MRKSEKEFLSNVGYEFISVHELQKKLGWSFQAIYDMADYLEKEGLIRRTKLQYDGLYFEVVCKPIDKRSWKDKYWLVIAVCSYLLGILSFVIKDYIGTLLK